MKKHLVFDCERMKHENTGLFHYCLNLGTHISKFMDPDAESLTYYTPYGTHAYFDENCRHINQYDIHKIRMPGLKNISIWHATYQDSYYIPFRNTNISVVLTIHDLNFMYDPSKPEWKKRKNLRRLQMLINRADALVCISEYCRKDLTFYCDIQNKPIAVIHNGTNTLSSPKLDTGSYRPEKPFIFSLGTINPKKNFHTLLPLVKNGNNMELIIAGRIDDPVYHDLILQTAQQMGIMDNLRIVGQVSEAEKSWYFNNCTAFAFPSTAEGFGLPVAEAMSVGKPLFLSNKTALPEIGGNVAFYFKDFSETIMQETFHSGMKQYVKLNMQHEIRQKGKMFSWDIAAEEYWKIYRSLY